MNTNTLNRTGSGRSATLLLLGGVAVLSALQLTMPEVEAQTAKAKTFALAPELLGQSWLNTPNNAPLTLASRRGEVTVVQFWTYGCFNCRNNLPAYQQLHQQFAKRGVEIIGVHTPESEPERKAENVARQVKELGITYPVLLDSDSQNWRRWNQRYWPTLYVLDRAGRVRFKWEGELEYKGAAGTKKVAALIENLLREPKPARAQAPTSIFHLVSDEKPAANPTPKKNVGRVQKSEAEWKKILTPMQFAVLRKKGTEAPFSGDSKPKKQPGIFRCAGCGLSLFTTEKMFDSGTGWPSFWQPIAGHANEHADQDGERVEVLCARCDGHLGHVFTDGPQPTGLRYCMNAVALKFAPTTK